MISKVFSNAKVVSLLLISMILTSCGKQKPMVKDVSVASSYVEDDLYLSLDTSLSIGNVNLPTVTIPILMPRTLEEVGTVQMQGGRSSENILKLKLNVSEVSKLDAGRSTLPNGVDLPIIGGNRVIEIPVSNRLKIYISIGDSVVALGVAVPFRTFDRIGAGVGTSAIFPMFYIRDIIGSAGIYTSKTSGENGFAIFADVTNTLSDIDFLDLNTQEGQVLEYNAKIPLESKKKKIDLNLLKLHRQRRQLRLY